VLETSSIRDSQRTTGNSRYLAAQAGHPKHEYEGPFGATESFPVTAMSIHAGVTFQLVPTEPRPCQAVALPSFIANIPRLPLVGSLNRMSSVPLPK
jgi:hypothetical protein